MMMAAICAAGRALGSPWGGPGAGADKVPADTGAQGGRANSGFKLERPGPSGLWSRP